MSGSVYEILLRLLSRKLVLVFAKVSVSLGQEATRLGASALTRPQLEMNYGDVCHHHPQSHPVSNGSVVLWAARPCSALPVRGL